MAAKKNSRLHDYVASEYIDFDPSNQSKRLVSLYSDFSKLSLLNEYGYNANVEYWRSLILDCSLRGYFTYHNYTLLLDKDVLAQDFLWKGQGKPLALNCVLETMEKNGEIMRLQDFERIYSSDSYTWSSWLLQRLPSLPFTRVSSHPSSLYVVMPSIKTIAQHICQVYTHLPVKTTTNSLLTFSEFRSHYGTFYDHPLTDNDLTLLLKYLASQSKVILENGVQGYGSTFMVIKFIEPGMAYKVTEQDKAMISIKTTSDALHHQIHHLQQQVERLTVSAQEYHNKKQKPQTLYALRRKKHIMEVLDKRLKSLDTIETILLKMETAQDDMQIIQAFDTGANALRSVLSSGLSVQSIEETMDKVQQVYDDQKDTEQAMMDGSTYLNNNEDAEYDDDLLLKELDELENQQRQEDEQQKMMTQHTSSTNTDDVKISQPSNVSAALLNEMPALPPLPKSSPASIKNEETKLGQSSRTAQLE
ncbi:Snf7-domain-containing protein [Absidia repens]|uniref:Snf7-domain-containing protein n=1 Tax=Absidia repens TaxID=90262 RepID=A0A1X2IC79_9FUNG|nr:Snf7-domain-containing protein [Absidia repens]